MNETESALTREQMMSAWRRRDASFDGLFFLGVRTTGIFCRPSCPSQPQPQHLEFFADAGLAVRAGYRPCKRCEPELADGRPPEWVQRLMRRAEKEPEQRITGCELHAMGVAPERARRWFQKHHGMTFAAWCRGLRLARAFTRIRKGDPLDDVILGHGFESHSGFRTAFSKAFGKPPRQAAARDCLRAALLETPLGPMLAVTGDQGVCQLEFADRRGLAATYAELRRRLELPVVPGSNAVMEQLRAELKDYFDGKRVVFTVPVAMRGTPFQERVWQALLAIPHGSTLSYEDVARRIGSATSVRAVARANATNRIYILIPCHRVVAKDGSLAGYGGGVWRKRLLLRLENERSAPGLHPQLG